MPSGGARARTGRIPDPEALRRDRSSDAATWRHLPAAGRQGDVPTWPLARATRRELAVWAAEWRRPQAVVWEENGQQTEVAMFVRSLVTAEKSGATVAARTLVRQQMDSLGLTIPGLRSNRFIIDGPDGEERSTNALPAPMRDRLEVLRGGA